MAIDHKMFLSLFLINWKVLFFCSPFNNVFIGIFHRYILFFFYKNAKISCLVSHLDPPIKKKTCGVGQQLHIPKNYYSNGVKLSRSTRTYWSTAKNKVNLDHSRGYTLKNHSCYMLNLYQMKTFHSLEADCDSSSGSSSTSTPSPSLKCQHDDVFVPLVTWS